ncbi:MAG: PilN domain-containing protein [Candidatus Eiseniibacteriota bacterium]|jgi:Tfp pilus assembly protein PilN
MIRINLLPYHTKKAGPRGGGGGGFAFDRTKFVPLLVLAVVLVGCVSTMMVQGARMVALQNDVTKAKEETERYKQTIALINEMVRKEQELNRRLALVETLDRDRFKTVRVLDEVAQRVPRYMWLTSMKNLSPQRVSFDGYAFSNLVVSDLMSSLEGSELFDNVELSVVQRKLVEGQQAVNFTVTTEVNPARIVEGS